MTGAVMTAFLSGGGACAGGQGGGAVHGLHLLPRRIREGEPLSRLSDTAVRTVAAMKLLAIRLFLVVHLEIHVIWQAALTHFCTSTYTRGVSSSPATKRFSQSRIAALEHT